MDKRKQNQKDFWDYSAYGTGSTEPPRNNGSLITVLLILVICLIGAVSALGWQNIRLFNQLNRQNQDATTPLPILEDSQIAGVDSMPELAMSAPSQDPGTLGISGEEISPFYQRYYQFPQGLYITRIMENSAAEALGLQPGDILLSINGSSITTPDSLQTLINSYSLGQSMELVIYRAGQQYSFQLILGDSGFSQR